MDRCSTRVLGGVALCMGVAGIGFLFADKATTVPPEQLLPRNSVVFVRCDGGDAHRDAWKKTAAFEALEESGLADIFTKISGALLSHGGGSEGIPGQFMTAAAHVRDHGFSLAGSLGADGPPQPWAILVLHDAAGLKASATDLAVGAARGAISFETKEVGTRGVTRGRIPNTPGIEIAWWAEQGHLVVVAGLGAVDAAIRVAEGGPNITDHPLWGRVVGEKADFEVTTAGWLDADAILAKFGNMPLPNLTIPETSAPATVRDIAEILGLDGLKTLGGRSGYKDRALWSESFVDAPGPRRGLLALSDQKLLTLGELPPMPASCESFTASSFDGLKAYDTLYGIALGIERLLPPSERGQVDGALAQLRGILGFDLKSDFLAAIGNVHCAYAESVQIPLGLGFGGAIEVRDAAKLKSSVDLFLALIEREAKGDLVVRRIDRSGQEVVLLEMASGAFSPAFSIGTKWLSLGIIPQSVDTFLMRQAGKLPRWEPSEELTGALAELPGNFTAITVSDPRPTYRLAMGLAPMALGASLAGLRESPGFPPEFQFPVTVADVPPTELVTEPLFVNVSVATVHERGMSYATRSSLPSLPFTGAMDGGTAITSTAILTALLLPAVQQAREAARRTRSKSNMHEILLGLYNYADSHEKFPEGTVPNEKLKPEERLSWQAAILPYLEESNLYRQLNLDEGWEHEANADALKTRLAVFQNPSDSDPPVTYGTTHYVGIAGLGVDGPELPANHPRAGFFAWNRATQLSDITDGTSSTIAISDGRDHGPWGAGGRATIRSLTTKPYINGPDGIGGPHQGGIHVGLADGSVRFVSETIDPSVLEALSTISGGEVIRPF